MATGLESNKNKIAKRVIEVFEYFGETNRRATVMDIVRRHGRPQSSTSELLASLVEMGLLYKDPATRSYSPTPRLNTLGSAAQPEVLRDGRLYAFMDRLARSTRFGVALFGVVGTHTQVFRWSCGAEPLTPSLANGDSERLSASAVGLLLLSTLGLDQARRVLWRLNAEAASTVRFDYAETTQRVARCARQGCSTGDAGFDTDARLVAVLLPRSGDERPLAIGIMVPRDSTVDTEVLTATLRHGIAQCIAEEPAEPLHLPAMLRAV